MANSWVSQTLRSVVADLDSDLESDEVSLDQVDSYLWRVELAYREILAQEVSGELADQEKEALPLIAEAHSKLRQVIEHGELALPSQASLLLDGNVGRPPFIIPYHQLEHLVQSGFSVPQIATLLGVSVSTIRRRMLLHNLSIRDTYSDMSDDELDAVVAEAQRQFPGWGNRHMYGYLLSRGIRVQFQRVRESQSRLDPEGTAMRRLHSLQRRRYCVPGPQHLWHIDGNHKLIR